MTRRPNSFSLFTTALTAVGVMSALSFQTRLCSAIFQAQTDAGAYPDKSSLDFP
jgi:hypothetical protein